MAKNLTTLWRLEEMLFLDECSKRVDCGVGSETEGYKIARMAY